jgi:hypothetical protein
MIRRVTKVDQTWVAQGLDGISVLARMTGRTRSPKKIVPQTIEVLSEIFGLNVQAIDIVVSGRTR